MAWPLQAAVDEEFRSFIDIHRRSVGELQHRVGSRARADRLSFANGGACFESARGHAVQTALSGNDRGPWTAGAHHGVDGVASDIHDRDE